MLDPAAHARPDLAGVYLPALVVGFLLVLEEASRPAPVVGDPLVLAEVGRLVLAADFPPGRVAAAQPDLAGVYPRVQVVVSRPGRVAGYQMALILGVVSLVRTTKKDDARRNEPSCSG
jgi:hypothetical protein